MSWPRYRFAQNGLGPLLLSPRLEFARQEILRLGPIAWYRYGVGITVATGVSQWDDQSGNGHHLKQGTSGAQPTLQSDNSILFDGSADYLKCTAFTLNQPETVYILFKQVSWTSTGTVFDGNTMNFMRLFQNTSTPELDMYAGTTGPTTTGAAVGTYVALAAVYNGASSKLQVNQGSTATSAGNLTQNGGGFTLGAHGGNLQFGNIQVKEVIIFPDAHDAATRSTLNSYLSAVNSL